MLDPPLLEMNCPLRAVLLDPALNERQKRVLLDVYASFVRENTPPAD